MHCRPSCTQGFVPSFRHLHLLTTATSHQQQSHRPAEAGPRLSAPLLCPPARPQEEAVLPGSRVKRSRDQNLPYSHRHPHFCHLTSTPPSHRHCGFSKPRSQKHTHTSHHPTRLVCFPSPWHRYIAHLFKGVFCFLCCIYPPLYLSLCWVLPKK